MKTIPGLVAAVLILALSGGSAIAAEPQLPAPDAPDTNVAIAADPFQRMGVQVFVNGQGPFRFLVDTGSDRTVVSGRLAAALQLPESGRATMHSFAGASRVDMVRISKLNVSSRAVSNLRAAALDEAHIGAEGLLGIDSLASQRITLDFRSEVMTISPGDKRAQLPTRAPGEGEVVVVRARPLAGQLVLTDARIGDTPVRVIIDTGASTSVGNMELRRQLLRRRAASPSIVELTAVDGATLKADLTVVPELMLGNLRFRDLPVAFVDAHPFRTFQLRETPALLLGMDVMSKMDEVTVDFASRTVRFVLVRDSGGAL